jgi:ribose 5-phosphate isomerase B
MADTIIIGSDHGGFRLKETIKKHLKAAGIETQDVGTHDESSCDYPPIAREVVNRAIACDGKAILICGTGIGMSIAANRIRGARAALCHDAFTAEMSRRHNDANVLVLGGRVTGESVATGIVDIWLKTEFEGGRHLKRISMFDEQ